MQNPYVKQLNFSTLQISNLSFVLFKETKMLLLKISENKYKYFVIPLDLKFRKENDIIEFSSESNSKQKIFDSYIKRFLIWLKSYNKKIKKKLYLKGLGYRCFLSDDQNQILFKIGYSHINSLSIPKNLSLILIDKTSISVEGYDGTLIGNFCQQIKNLKLPNIYKGKGFLYKNEKFLLKPIKKS